VSVILEYAEVAWAAPGLHRSAPSAAPSDTETGCHEGKHGNWPVTGNAPAPDS